jgi:hypothetical protein
MRQCEPYEIITEKATYISLKYRLKTLRWASVGLKLHTSSSFKLNFPLSDERTGRSFARAKSGLINEKVSQPHKEVPSSGEVKSLFKGYGNIRYIFLM